MDPNSLSQGFINVCGPAAFCRIWIPRDPLGFVNLAVGLYETGMGYVGSRRVEPDEDLKQQAWDAAWDSPEADWMVMSSLRDDDNWLWDFEGTPEETVAAATTPSEVAEWLQDARLYARVRDEGNWATTKGLDHAKSLNPTVGRDVVVLINAHLLSDAAVVHGQKKSDEFILRAFPNHFIVLDSPVQESPGGKVAFSYWTWGDPVTRVEVGKAIFEANYYGAIIAEVSVA
jgi:hypothetical protein